MILLELDSNIKTFHKIKFKVGLNFIIGKRANPEKRESKDSYNGVGKSLVIELVHFCLGANKVKALATLGNHYCVLKIEHSNRIYSIKRYFCDQQLVYLDNELISLKDLRLFLTEICFPNIPKENGISFRSLMARFIRRYKQNYSVYSKYIKGEQTQITLLNNAYLLGIDYNKIISKINNKTNYMILNSTKKSLKEDKLLVQYFEGKGSIEFKIKDIEEQINFLIYKRTNFKVAENYNQLKHDADELAITINSLVNEKIILQHRIDKINKALEIKPEFHKNYIQNLYEQMYLHLPDLIVKNIDDICHFHNELCSNRIATFNTQKAEYELRLSQINNQLAEFNTMLDKKLELLSNCGALEEFNALSETISKTQQQLSKLKDYKQLISDYEKEIALSKKRKAEISIENQEYLEKNLDLQEKLMNTFREFSRKFYTDKPSGLTVEINTKDNKLSFDINADIEGDSSDGINEVKIFCFDMTLLTLSNHDVEFLFHDSRLLSNMDPRQRIVWLDIIRTYFNNNSYQYIVSINEDMILTMRDVVDEEKYKEILKVFENNVCIYLTDECPESKLLGLQANIKYDN